MEGELGKGNIKGIEDAVRHVIAELRKKDCECKEYQYSNHHKHAVIETEDGVLYYILFKREVFLSFGKIFNMKGAGESINKEQLNDAQKYADVILIVYPSGAIYAMSPVRWKMEAQELGTIRETESKELTYSVPINLLKRWNQ